MTRTIDLDGLQRMLWSFAGHRVLTVAARTGIVRLLAEHDATPDEVASQLELDPLATRKIVRALTALGILEAEGESYRVTGSLRRFFTPGKDDLTPFVEHSHRLYTRWGESLEPWLRGENWPTTARTPEEVAAFGAAMRSMGSHQARRAAAALDLEGVERVLDVGGGWGQFSMALCSAKPGLQATVLDIPEVARQATSDLVGGEFEDRIMYLPGDYLETDFGRDWDLVLFANVLHQETAEGAAELVRRAAEALAPGGRVVVVDFAIDDEGREHLLGVLFAVNMRSFGDTWSEPTLRGWMEAAGLENVERTDLGPDRWMISGTLSGEGSPSV